MAATSRACGCSCSGGLLLQRVPLKSTHWSQQTPMQHQHTGAAKINTHKRQHAAVVTPAPTKDLTAEIMQAAISLALQARLTQHKGITAEVLCDARSVLEGRFNKTKIEGQHWQTPLMLTAHRIEVDIGELHVDYGTLITQQRVALRNKPKGYTRIVLSAKDLGNFVTHPIFKDVAKTAVQGHPFHFDKDTVQIKHSPAGGDVHFQGVWAANGERYQVLMRPSRTSSTGGSGRAQLQVGAQHLKQPGSGGSSSSSSSSSGSGSADLAGAQEVAAGIAHFFTSMAIDLQGIELQSPSLQLHSGGAYQSAEGDLLDIGMKVRIRAFPPLDMKF